MQLNQATEDFNARATGLLHACKKAARRVRDKIYKQESERVEAQRYETYQQWADTLLSLPDADRKGASALTIQNIHTGEVETIALNPKLSTRQNAQLYYKKSKKGKRGLALVEQKVTDSKAVEGKLAVLLDACESLLQGSPQAHAGIHNLDDIQRQLVELGVNFPETAAQSPRMTDSSGKAFREYRFDGWSVFIGKNDSQNDELTTRFARPQDIWMHAAGCSGSHVIIRREKSAPWPPPEILRKAASLAVWFSKAKHASSCEVHYTEARYVQKRKKSPPGEVVLLQYKSLRVAPVSPQHYFPGHYTT